MIQSILERFNFATYGFYDWLELVAMILGIIYVVYEIRKSITMWYFMIASAVAFLIFFWHEQFWAMWLIQIYYIVSGVYSIFKWRKIRAATIAQHGYDDPKKEKKIAIVKMNPVKVAVSSGIAIVVFFVLAWALGKVGDTPLDYAGNPWPAKHWWDAALAVGSMLATYWLSQSYFEQWYMWMVVNIMAVGVFLKGGQYWTMILYAVYITMVIIGIITWRRYGVIVDEKANTAKTE